MITKEELKKEVDKLPENLVEEVYTSLQQIKQQRKNQPVKDTFSKWKQNLNKFTPDFMSDRDQSFNQSRESLD